MAYTIRESEHFLPNIVQTINPKTNFPQSSSRLFRQASSTKIATNGWNKMVILFLNLMQTLILLKMQHVLTYVQMIG